MNLCIFRIVFIGFIHFVQYKLGMDRIFGFFFFYIRSGIKFIIRPNENLRLNMQNQFQAGYPLSVCRISGQFDIRSIATYNKIIFARKKTLKLTIFSWRVHFCAGHHPPWPTF